MAAPATVTLDDVLDAAREIVARGRVVNGGSLRQQIGRGDPRRLFALWEQSKADAPPETTDRAVAPAVTLPPALIEQETALQSRISAELSAAIIAAWSLAERTANDRLGAEMAAARASAATARAELEEMAEILAAADRSRETAEAERDLAMAESAEARAAEARSAGIATAAEAGRSQLAEELAAIRELSVALERRAAAAEAASEAANAAARDAQATAAAAREQAETDRRQAATEVATARAQAIAAQETAATLQAEVIAAREAMTAAAEERGRLLQRAEAAESLVASADPVPTTDQDRTPRRTPRSSPPA